ncbi:hypothetical protein CCHOA_08030 [Corynebacterium choanae]|uniref:Uncharacterized protein n=1 Tax=Corynebacterium choanae TaxID=1862358 RepID=A0A3G6JAP9_9CORY|nr:hypothetical protein CCHOA_08030 [Corynebacterium choanae]
MQLVAGEGCAALCEKETAGVPPLEGIAVLSYCSKPPHAAAWEKNYGRMIEIR